MSSLQIEELIDNAVDENEVFLIKLYCIAYSNNNLYQKAMALENLIFNSDSEG